MDTLLITPYIKEFHAAREVFRAKEVSNDSYGASRAAVSASAKEKIVILSTGVGREKVLTSLKHCNPKNLALVIDSGSCGSLRKNFVIGNILCGNIAFNEQGLSLKTGIGLQLEGNPAISCCGAILEVENPILNKSRHSEVCRDFEVDACTMETYTVAEWARSHAIDWISLRVVTDDADERTPEEFRKNIRPYSMELYNAIKNIFHSGFRK